MGTSEFPSDLCKALFLAEPFLVKHRSCCLLLCTAVSALCTPWVNISSSQWAPHYCLYHTVVAVCPFAFHHDNRNGVKCSFVSLRNEWMWWRGNPLWTGPLCSISLGPAIPYPNSMALPLPVLSLLPYIIGRLIAIHSVYFSGLLWGSWALVSWSIITMGLDSPKAVQRKCFFGWLNIFLLW